MIHLENVTKYYDELCAVDQISLDIKNREILGLLGPNGAGKTTTLRMLTGFLKLTSGSIVVKDYNISENSLEIRKLMGYLPESAPLYREMLVYDYLYFIAELRGFSGKDIHDRICQLSQICNINSVMHQPVTELSKGFKQRVGLAHAMMSDPEILVLDEPTSGLDPNQIIEIREIIKKIGKEKTVILSTHILSEAEATCDRIVIIDKGKIAVDEKTENLKLSSKGEKVFCVSLKNADIKQIKGRIESIDTVIKVSEKDHTDDNIQSLVITCSDDARDRIYQEIKQTDSILVEFYQETETLEKIFREITKA